MNKRDQLYKEITGPVGDFVFDERVAHVFTDMIHRSVPGYSLILEMLGVITANYAQPATRCYDLGCSLGASTLAIRCRLDDMKSPDDEHYRVIAVDSSPAMIDRCRVNLARIPSSTPTEINCQSIQQTTISHASLVVLNFTLQFIPVDERQSIVNRIADGMVAGGALVISEKVSFAGSDSDDMMTQLHHNFKRARGYSALEISHKRSALEKVLLPESIDCHQQRLKKAGFRYGEVWFQCASFVSFLAIKC